MRNASWVKFSVTLALWISSAHAFASEELTLTLTSAGHFAGGEPIFIHKTLRNVSETPVIITELPLWGETILMLEGHEQRTILGDGAPVRSGDDYRVLAPGQAIQWSEDLSVYHITPGRWTVKMSVGYGTPMLRPPEYPMAWSGVVQSNTLEFRLSE